LMSRIVGILDWGPWLINWESGLPGSRMGIISDLGYNFRVQSSAYVCPIFG
jgi:hypothetical protein